ncbi:hypothetical protein HYH02_004321 [Chlamydomonas schloesseri]|uniref:Right handed beta helix domain-containing protein n=1 Tax=Chlamydomonas schloesseri TaxID=2026947 RepID=A0A835WPP3_9CHLO|nr:hypothetical protein HYH02_004321 [Chlamydomonas schloesseri]|eukprot:KAG2451053.1 hypothetical protein HYH02_004321 [Chlamydomonas schloesseri]
MTQLNTRSPRGCPRALLAMELGFLLLVLRTPVRVGAMTSCLISLADCETGDQDYIDDDCDEGVQQVLIVPRRNVDSVLDITGTDIMLDGNSLDFTARHLDLTLPGGGPSGRARPSRLLSFTDVKGLVLQNLRFEHLVVAGPVLSLERCSKVRMVNVTFSNITMRSAVGVSLIRVADSEAFDISAGDGQGRGGDVFVDANSTLEVASSTFDGGMSVGGGGSLAAVAANMTVSSSVFTRCNTTIGGGGCIFSEPGANGSRTNHLVLRDCEFLNSTAAAGQGGAVHVSLHDNDTAAITIERTRFTANNATEASMGPWAGVRFWGGALAVVGTCRPDLLHARCRNQTNRALQSTTHVVNCSFVRNTATRAGALEAVYNTAQGLFLSGVEFLGNEAHDTAGLLAYVIPHVSIEDSLFFNQTAALVSGARLASIHSAVNVSRTVFRSNVCNLDNRNTGSALYVHEDSGVTVDGDRAGPIFDFHLSDCTFEDNWSSSEGGGLTVQRCPAYINNVTFARNRASKKGGALYLERDLTATLTEMKGVQKRNASARLTRVSFTDNYAAVQGGALAADGWDVELTGVTFADNRVEVFTAGGMDNAGGAAFFTGCPKGARMSQAQLSRNRAYQGGAIAAEYCSLNLAGVTLADNSAANDAGALLFVGFAGGADGGAGGDAAFTLALANSSLERNTARVSAGAVKVYWAGLSVTNTVFANNSANALGGSMLLLNVPPQNMLDALPSGTAAAAVLDNCTFVNNSARTSGGAVYHSVSAVEFRGVTLRGNRAGNRLFSDAWSNAGGAVFGLACSRRMRLLHSTLEANSAEGRGGAVALLSCEAEAAQSSFTGNTAKLSGGCIAAGHQVSSEAPQGPPLILDTCTVTGNTAVDEHGGALFLSSVQLEMRHSVTASNRAGQAGGALYAVGSAQVQLINSTLQDSTAGTTGGGAHLEACASVSVTASRIRGNAGGISGGGLSFLNTECSLLADTQVEVNTAGHGAGLAIAAPIPSASGRGCDSTALSTAAVGWSCADGLDAVISTYQKANLTIRHASCNMSLSRNVAGDGAGGGLLLEAVDGAHVLYGLRAESNTAAASGGAIALANTRRGVALVHVAAGALASNTAGDVGGALAADAAIRPQQVTLTDTLVERNTAPSGGGLSLRANASAWLHNCSFHGNRATGAAGVEGRGGSVQAEECRALAIAQSSMRACSAAGDGGCVWSDSCAVVTLTDNRFSGSSALGSGGAVFVTAASVRGPSLLLVRGGRMSGNAAGSSNSTSGAQATGALGVLPSGSGGALVVSGTVAGLVSRVQLDSNYALGMGGAAALNLQCPQQQLASVTSSTAVNAGAPPTTAARAVALLDSFLSTTASSNGIGSGGSPFGSTLQVLAAAAKHSLLVTGCWPVVLDAPVLWNNTAQGSGGGVYVVSDEAVAVLCDSPTAAGAVSPDQQDQQLAAYLSGVVPKAATALLPQLSGLGAGGFAAAGGPPPPASAGSELGQLSASVVDSQSMCFTAPLLAMEDPATAGNGSSSRGGEAKATNRATGYGSQLATAPKQLVLGCVGENNPPPIVSSENVANDPDCPVSSDGTITDLCSSSSTVNRGGNDSSAVAVPVPSWLRRAQLRVGGRMGLSCWPEGGSGGAGSGPCRLTWPNSVALDLSLSVHDAIGQLVNDAQSAPPVIRAAVLDPGAYIIGNPLTLAEGGTAALSALRLQAPPGRYRLNLSMELPGVQIDPLPLLVEVPPCAQGEVALLEGEVCSRCAEGTFTFDNWLSSNSSNSSDWRCHPCPDNALCPGGSVVVPEGGYWQSAANSTQMHQCAVEDACRAGDDDATQALVRCQERWYAYFGLASRLPSVTANSTDGGAALVRSYLQAYLAALNGSGPPYTPGQTGLDGFDGFLLDCALWGVPPDSPHSYMQMQCSEGYTGNLCATCVPINGTPTALNSDMACNLCYKDWQTVLIGVAMFLANTLALGFSVLTTFLSDYSGGAYGDGGEGAAKGPTDQQQHKLPAAGILKLAIVHFQMFLIVTGIGLSWPSPVITLQNILGSATGNVKQVYSPSCLVSSADSAQQATVQVLSGLLLPIASVVLVLLIWTARYYLWNQRWFHEATAAVASREAATAAAKKEMQKEKALEVEDSGDLEGGDVGAADIRIQVSISASTDVASGPQAGRAGASRTNGGRAGPVAEGTEPLPQQAASITRGGSPARSPSAAAGVPHLLQQAASIAAGRDTTADTPAASIARGGKLGPKTASQRLSGVKLFRDRAALSFLDAAMSLWRQLFLVLMVSCFILMPTWAQEALSIFACYPLDDGQGPYPENQRAVWSQGWWVRDMNQQCYQGTHLNKWVPIGSVSFAVLCLAMPVVCAVMLFIHRWELRSPRVLQTYGFLYTSYKPKYYLWESVSQTQVMLLVIVDVFGRTLLVTQQALLLEVVLLANLVINSFFSPLLQEELTLLQLLSSGAICLTVCLGLIASVPGNRITAAGDATLGAIVVAINCIIIAAFVFAFVRRGLPGFRTSVQAAKAKVVSARQLLRQRLSRKERAAAGQQEGREGGCGGGEGWSGPAAAGRQA